MARTVTLAEQPEMVETNREQDIPSSPPETANIVSRMNAAYDWTGPDDPDNPRNFSATKRTLSIAIITSLAFASTFGGSIYAPAQDAARGEFGTSLEVAVMPLSLFNLGLAFGPLIGAPLSETYGRKFVFAATTPMYILFMIGAGFTEDIASFTVCRFFAGVFASPNISNASALILDYTASRHRGASLYIYYAFPTIGATVAPLVGGFVVQSVSWRWTQRVAVILTFTLYIPLLFTPETYKKVILRRRALKMGLADMGSQRSSASKTIRHFFTVLIVRPLHMLVTEPIVTFVSLYNGFLYGLLYAFVVAIPWIFEHYYGFSKAESSFSYLGVTLGTVFAIGPLVAVDFLYYQKLLARQQGAEAGQQSLPPERRLICAMIGSILLPIGLFTAGWTAQHQVHWFVPILFQGVTTLSSLLIYASANLFMLDSYGPLYGASASGAMMLSRYLMSFAFPTFALQIFQKLGVGWASSLLGFCTIAMAPIPFLFWTYGQSIRRRSRYESD